MIKYKKCKINMIKYKKCKIQMIKYKKCKIQMIKYKKWRQLFYQLTEKYPDCTLLNYVIKLVSDAGHQGEITNLSTAAAQLEVFARVIKTSIENR